MEWYLTARSVHITAVTVSIGLFMLRGLWMLSCSRYLQQPWTRVVPHVIDTVLLASAVVLAVSLRQYPFVQPWLTAKVLALLVYIGLGSVALKRCWPESINANMVKNG